jgi:Fe-S cluster assembly iron-binding protein IscA
MLTLTDAAAEAIHALTSQPGMPATAGVRITPNPDSTGGAALAMSLADGPAPSDEVVESRQARVYLEPDAAGQLEDKVLDAKLDNQGGFSFRVRRQSASPA